MDDVIFEAWCRNIIRMAEGTLPDDDCLLTAWIAGQFIADAPEYSVFDESMSSPEEYNARDAFTLSGCIKCGGKKPGWSYENQDEKKRVRIRCFCGACTTLHKTHLGAHSEWEAINAPVWEPPSDGDKKPKQEKKRLIKWSPEDDGLLMRTMPNIKIGEVDEFAKSIGRGRNAVLIRYNLLLEKAAKEKAAFENGRKRDDEA